MTVQPSDPEDQALSTTVIPYLCDLHFGSQGDCAQAVEQARNGAHAPRLVSGKKKPEREIAVSHVEARRCFQFDLRT